MTRLTRLAEIDQILSALSTHTYLQPWAQARWPAETRKFLRERYNPRVGKLVAERDRLLEALLRTAP